MVSGENIRAREVDEDIVKGLGLKEGVEEKNASS